MEYAQNLLRHSAAKLTPFQCVLGYQPPLLPWNPNIAGVPAVDEWFKWSEQVCEGDHQCLESPTETRKHFAVTQHTEAPAYKLADRMWLSTQDPGGLTG